MALNIPFMAIAQAINVLLPITKKRTKSEEAEAKTTLADNPGPLSTLTAVGLVTGGVVYGSLEEAVYGVVAALVGIGFYLYKGK